MNASAPPPQIKQLRCVYAMHFFFLFFFFLAVYLTLALNSPVKMYSLIHANIKKACHINKAKYTIKCFLHIVIEIS